MLIQVAVAVIVNDNDEIVISRRAADQHQGNKWEFPGGKLEAGESPEQALTRELKEELGVEVLAQQSLLELSHEYPDRYVNLYVYRITEFRGEPKGLENQALQWVLPVELNDINFLSGNKKIVAAVQALST